MEEAKDSADETLKNIPNEGFIAMLHDCTYNVQCHDIVSTCSYRIRHYNQWMLWTATADNIWKDRCLKQQVENQKMQEDLEEHQRDLKKLRSRSSGTGNQITKYFYTYPA